MPLIRLTADITILYLSESIHILLSVCAFCSILVPNGCQHWPRPREDAWHMKLSKPAHISKVPRSATYSSTTTTTIVATVAIVTIVTIVPYPHPGIPVQRMQSSKAAEIPEELFEHIIYRACGGRDWGFLNRDDKQHVSVFSLVCRYWAHLCLPRLFFRITLRTPSDAKRFHKMLDTPLLPGLKPLTHMISMLTAAPDSRDEPWLHLVFFLSVPRLRSLMSFYVEPLHPGKQPLRNLHPSLPRSLPCPRRPLDHLRLDRLYFSTGRDLSRLLSSIPSLKILRAFNLVFAAKIGPDDLFSTPCPQMFTETDNLHLCLSFIPHFVNVSSIMQAATKRHRRGYRKSILNEYDHRMLWDLLNIFDAAPSFNISWSNRGEYGFVMVCVLTFITFLGRIVVCCYQNPSNPQFQPEIALCLEVHLSHFAAHQPLRQSAAQRVLPESLQVRAITINLCCEISEKAQEVCNEPVWMRFVEAALKFRHLQHVEVLRRNVPARELTGSGSLREPAFLGITDNLFKPLIEAGKFVYRSVNSDWSTLRTVTDTVDPNTRENQASVEPSKDGKDRESHAKLRLEEAMGETCRPAEGCCKYPLLYFILSYANMYVQREYSAAAKVDTQ